ncbi:MAG: endolytic transglycosylase MltG [Anaerolineales bacterium]|nr:MAG: endolytic transglycosylase MltG [Anaerolineales bacterium]
MGIVFRFIRFVFRFVVFLIALAAIAVIVGGGIWYFRTQGQGQMTIALNDVPGQRQPEGPEDWMLSVYLQSRADEINTPLSDQPTPVSFVVEFGETALSISARLEGMGLISDATLFRRFLQYHGLDASLEAGEYQLRRNMAMREIAEALQHSRMQEVVITIPEGWRAEQVSDLLTDENIMDGSVFLAAVRQGVAIDHPLLADRPDGVGFEGYLFPDTYRLPAQASPEDLLTRMLDTMQARLPIGWEGMGAAQGLTFYQVLIVASIVEREAVVPEERPTIASVYLNRLQQDMYLQADPTVQYAMGYQPDTDQWWKTPVTLEEYQGVNSPYNTYLFPGLPPGPICSPGASSILAVLQPTQTPYLFFLARGDGSHVFAETFEEHERNIQLYQGQ